MTSYMPSHRETTLLVDNLLTYTRKLMDTTATEKTTSNHILAFSGGVDSSLVAQLLHTARLPGETVTAVLGLSPAVPQQQVELAQDIAAHIGINLQTVQTNEGQDAMYIENAGQACLACKTHLYSTLRAIHASHTANTPTTTMLFYNGTNADDLLDPTRLGLIAADEFQIQSPLRQTPKEQVRQAARHLNLPNWDYAASPCLRSRLALGVPATHEHLKRIELAETLVKNALQVDATVNLRVRMLSGNRACIEVDGDWLEAASRLDLNQQLILADKRTRLFEDVLVRAFKSGSVARKDSRD